MIRRYLACFTQPQGKLTCSVKPKTKEEAERWFASKKLPFTSPINDFSQIGDGNTRHLMETGVISTKLLLSSLVKDEDMEASVEEFLNESEPTEEEIRKILTDPNTYAEMYVTYRFGKEVYRNF